MSTEDCSQYYYDINTYIDSDITWTDDLFSQLYQIIQLLFAHNNNDSNSPNTNTVITKYIRYILGYESKSGLPQSGLGIVDLRQRFEEGQKLKTLMQIPPELFQTEWNKNNVILSPHSTISKQLCILKTYAIVTNNPALLSWILFPFSLPHCISWDQRIPTFENNDNDDTESKITNNRYAPFHNFSKKLIETYKKQFDAKDLDKALIDTQQQFDAKGLIETSSQSDEEASQSDDDETDDDEASQSDDDDTSRSDDNDTPSHSYPPISDSHLISDIILCCQTKQIKLTAGSTNHLLGGKQQQSNDLGQLSSTILLNLLISTTNRYKDVILRYLYLETQRNLGKYGLLATISDVMGDLSPFYIFWKNKILTSPISSYEDLQMQGNHRTNSTIFRDICRIDDLKAFKLLSKLFLGGLENIIEIEGGSKHFLSLLFKSVFSSPKIFHFSLKKKFFTMPILFELSEEIWTDFMKGSSFSYQQLCPGGDDDSDDDSDDDDSDDDDDNDDSDDSGNDDASDIDGKRGTDGNDIDGKRGNDGIGHKNIDNDSPEHKILNGYYDINTIASTLLSLYIDHKMVEIDPITRTPKIKRIYPFAHSFIQKTNQNLQQQQIGGSNNVIGSFLYAFDIGHGAIDVLYQYLVNNNQILLNKLRSHLKLNFLHLESDILVAQLKIFFSFATAVQEQDQQGQDRQQGQEQGQQQHQNQRNQHPELIQQNQQFLKLPHPQQQSLFNTPTPVLQLDDSTTKNSTYFDQQGVDCLQTPPRTPTSSSSTVTSTTGAGGGFIIAPPRGTSRSYRNQRNTNTSMTVMTAPVLVADDVEKKYDTLGPIILTCSREAIGRNGQYLIFHRGFCPQELTPALAMCHEWATAFNTPYIEIITIPFIFAILSRRIHTQIEPLKLVLSKSNRYKQFELNINVNSIVDILWIDNTKIYGSSEPKLIKKTISPLIFLIFVDKIAKEEDIDQNSTSNQYGITLYTQHPAEFIIESYIEALFDHIEDELYPRKKNEIILDYSHLASKCPPVKMTRGNFDEWILL